MNSKNQQLVVFLFIFSLITILIGLTWVNYRYSQQNPGGSDFLPRWVGTRSFLFTGQSPYSKETIQEIQNRFYGRQALPDEDQVLFVYPFYSFFIFTPFALIADFNLARGIWMTVLEVSIVLITLGAISLSHWKSSKSKLIFMLFFALVWYFSVRPLINSNASILVALFVVGTFLAIRRGWDILAGFLLALAMIKPQMVVLLILYILIWSLYTQRFVIFWSFVCFMVLMITTTSLLIPDWIWQNFHQVLSYPEYTLPGTPGAIFEQWVPGMGKQMGWVLTIILTSILIWEWRASLGKNLYWFTWTAHFSLAATTMIGIRTATENYIVLLPAVILVFATWDQDWGRLGSGLIGLSYVMLLFGVWWLFLTTLIRDVQPIQSSIMFFPLPIFLMIGLYWIRRGMFMHKSWPKEY